MMERYSHIRMEAKRLAVDDLSGIDFEPGAAQNWAQFFISEKTDEAKSLKRSGEPGRTRTYNPLIKSPKLTVQDVHNVLSDQQFRRLLQKALSFFFLREWTPTWTAASSTIRGYRRLQAGFEPETSGL